MGQLELVDAVQVFLARAAFDHFQLTGDQGVPYRMLLLRVIDKTMRIGLACHVLRLFHVALLVRAFLVMCRTCLRNIPSLATLHGVGQWAGPAFGDVFVTIILQKGVGVGKSEASG
ncbi:hypothetical protein D3C78_1075510 [compost metagenome]